MSSQTEFLNWTHRKLQVEFERLRDRFHVMKDNLRGLSASVSRDHYLEKQTRNPKSYEESVKRDLATQLGMAILNSPFCTLHKRVNLDDGEAIFTANVTLYEPEVKGKQTPSL